jgi:hypothetical protein
VEAHHESVKGVWEERYEQRYGFWRGFVDAAIPRRGGLSLSFYMDEHVPGAITAGLRTRHVVLTAQEDGRTGATDGELLDRATVLGAWSSLRMKT